MGGWLCQKSEKRIQFGGLPQGTDQTINMPPTSSTEKKKMWKTAPNNN